MDLIDKIVDDLDANEMAVDIEKNELVDCYSKSGCDWCYRYYRGCCSRSRLKEWLVENLKGEEKNEKNRN